ncbi:MAG TPA: hypothetical protein VF187_11870, partial [Gemmatimonadales bacterium]
ERLLARGQELERLHQELLPPGAPGAAPPVALLRPYQVAAAPGRPFQVEVLLRNPFDRPEAALVRLAVPEGWVVEPADGEPACQEGILRVPMGAGERAAIAFCVTPSTGLSGRRPIAADVTIRSTRFGQCAEAVVILESRGGEA